MTIHAEPLTSIQVETVSHARADLTKHLIEIRNFGLLAPPVLIGSHRKPEAALIPAEMFQKLLPHIEELRLEALVARRIATEKSAPLSDLISELGLEDEVK